MSKPRSTTTPSFQWPRITVVTPSYNQAQFLEATIQSVLNQHYPNLEYIIMDGGSTDGSQKIIKKYQRYLTYWTSKPDKGQADAINQGFKHGTGEIMAWINSDDLLLPGSLEIVGQVFAQHPDIDWVTGQQVIIEASGVPVKTSLPYGRKQSWIAQGWYHGRALGFIGQEATFWRRTLWQKAGGKLTLLHYALDFELWRRFAQHAPLTSVVYPLGAFRLNPDRKTHQLDGYYKEVGTHLPNWIRVITLPLKVVVGTTLLYLQKRVIVTPPSTSASSYTVKVVG